MDHVHVQREGQEELCRVMKEQEDIWQRKIYIYEQGLTNRSGKSDVDRGPGRLKRPALKETGSVLDKKCTRPLVSKDDGKS